MKTTLHLALTFASLLAASCGVGADPAPNGSNDSNSGLTSNACTVAGGSCVGVSPGACSSNNWGDPASCGGGVGVGCCLAAQPAACAPLPAPVGDPASSYCAAMGYTLSNVETAAGQESHCHFPDGTECDEWAFLHGECGQAHSFCARQGGTVSSQTRNQGTWTGQFAVCTLPGGTSCDEVNFALSCDCQ